MTASTTPLFLYGTLRACEALSHLIPNELVRYGATVPGRLHYAPHTSAYPVLLPPLSEADVVIGELVYTDLESRDIAYVVLMELQSGYSATWCNTYVPGLGRVEALTFTWHPSDGMGDLIVSGDWTDRAIGGVHFQCRGCHALYPLSDEAEACEWGHDVMDDLSYALQKEG